MAELNIFFGKQEFFIKKFNFFVEHFNFLYKNSMDPADYLVSEAPKDLPTEVLLYYTQCESVRSNPFTLRLRESQNAINNARSSMNIVSR